LDSLQDIRASAEEPEEIVEEDDDCISDVGEDETVRSQTSDFTLRASTVTKIVRTP